jgi:hypothetical protein
MINTIESMLSQVNTINNSYEKVAESTGENFNVFSVLRIEHYEDSTHSRFLAELLNPKGSHAFKDAFLKLFIEEIDSYNNLKIELNTNTSFVQTEYFISSVDTKNKTGGRIDILIQDSNGNKILIENKVYAEEQLNQLERYFKFDNNATLLFLTLVGKESKFHKTFDAYKSISYEINIVNWLDRCQQVAVDNPVVRETIKQYKNLIKKLTNQNINKDMEREILDLVTKNFKASELITKNFYSAKEKLIEIQRSILIEILSNNKLEYNIERALRNNDGVFITMKEFSDYDLGINVEMTNNWFFFCVAKKGGVRDLKNNHKDYYDIKDFLHSKIEGLTTTAYSIGKSNNFMIGLNNENFFLPEKDNTEVFERLAKRFLEFKNILS